TGQNAVDLDVLAGPRGGQAAGHLDHGALRSGVHSGDIETEDAGHRADRDDLAATALLHLGVDRLATRERAGQIGVDDVVPLVHRVVFRRFADIAARVGNEDVE